METLLGKFENYVAEHNICSHGDRHPAGCQRRCRFDGDVVAVRPVGLQDRRSALQFPVAGPRGRGRRTVRGGVCENKLGVPHDNIRFDTLREMERTGESVQMAARRLRYDWFDSLCDELRLYAHRHCPPRRRFGGDFFINLFAAGAVLAETDPEMQCDQRAAHHGRCSSPRARRF